MTETIQESKGQFHVIVQMALILPINNMTKTEAQAYAAGYAQAKYPELKKGRILIKEMIIK